MPKVKRNGLPLDPSFDQESRVLTVGEHDFTLDEWISFRREMDRMMRHMFTDEEWQECREKLAWIGKADRLPAELREYEKPKSVVATNFISKNFEALNKIKSGIVKRPPKELRDEYIAVVVEDEEDFSGD